MKISLSTYSFNSLMTRGEMTLLDAPKRARELGFEAIEICANTELESGNLEYAKDVRKECDANGITVSTFVFGANLLSGNEKSDNNIFYIYHNKQGNNCIYSPETSCDGFIIPCFLHIQRRKNV